MVDGVRAKLLLSISDKPIIVKFNPWNYSDTAQLIKQFFNTIMSEIEINSSGKELKKVASAIEKYSDILEYSQYIPIIGKYLKPIKGLKKHGLFFGLAI